MIIGSAIRVDTKPCSFLGGIDVGAKEQELPSILFFLALDHGLELLVGILAAGILQIVSGDNEQRLFRTIFLSCVLMDIANVMDCTTHRIQQRCAAADIVFFPGQRFDPLDIHPIMDY